MNESLQFSRLASTLLQELSDIADSIDEDAAIYARSIEAILESYSRVDGIVSLRKPNEATEPDAQHFNDPDDAIN